jgi:Tfp pilus assembly protein PilX
VLIIALIVLVSMTLAAIGMSRSIDTANLVAGNLAFKQATVQGGEIGLKQAFTWLGANSAGTTLQNSDPSNGYFSSVLANDPNWYDANDPVWGNAVLVNGGVADNAGNIVKYVIHRLCTQPNTAYNQSNGATPNQCAITFETGGTCEGCSNVAGGFQGTAVAQLYYRVTTRVEGPRNTVSVVQMSVLIKV